MIDTFYWNISYVFKSNDILSILKWFWWGKSSEIVIAICDFECKTTLLTTVIHLVPWRGNKYRRMEVLVMVTLVGNGLEPYSNPGCCYLEWKARLSITVRPKYYRCYVFVCFVFRGLLRTNNRDGIDCYSRLSHFKSYNSVKSCYYGS